MSILSSLPGLIERARKEYEEYVPGDYEIYEHHGEDDGNQIVHGECLDYMKYLMDVKGMKGKINLIYVDPPFFTKLKHEAVIRHPATNDNVSIPAYSDQWEQGTDGYFLMLITRLFAMKDLLADDGALWVHLDWHISHYIKAILDEIFGMKNFVNEVAWTYKSGGSTKRHFSRKHDTLLFYSKTPSYYFKPQVEKSYNRGFKPYRFKGVEEFEDEVGWYTLVNMKDVWAIDMVGRTSSERTGYATQKPEALLMRIMESCSREGDICADFFGGSGTTAAAAAKMGRRFISCDGGDLAVGMSIRRMDNIGTGFDVIGQKGKIHSKNDKKTDEISVRDDIIDIGVYIDNREKTDAAIDMWSIDLDYDGMVHRPDFIFRRDKTGIKKEISLVSRQFSLFDNPDEDIKCGEHISIVFYDILGNRTQYIY